MALTARRGLHALLRCPARSWWLPEPCPSQWPLLRRALSSTGTTRTSTSSTSSTSGSSGGEGQSPAATASPPPPQPSSLADRILDTLIRPHRPRLVAVAVAGPSGVGKNFTIQQLVQRDPQLLAHSVSHTTRPPRPGEIDGVHYHFVTDEEMEAMERDEQMLETDRIHGATYGTSLGALRTIEGRGQVAVLDLTLPGIQRLKAAYGERCLSLFLRPPSIEALAQRLAHRGSETPERTTARLHSAQRELELADTAYGPAIDHVLVKEWEEEDVP